MWSKIMGKSMVSLWLAVTLLLWGVTAQGEQRYDIHNDPVAYTAIEYSGSIDALPLSADGQGRAITIDDKVYNLEDNCIFRNQFGNLVGLASFNAGMSVRFFVRNKTDISKLWHVESEGENNENDHIDTGRVPATDGDIKKVNGVWTN